jgi:hypothetical protein
MPLAVFVLLFKFIAEVVRVIVRKMREVKPEPLCAECFFAHVQYGANARRSISCTYGGEVRPMKLDVLYCTDYRARNVPLRPGVIGFVREITPGE